MPNWIEGTLKLRGKREDIRKFIDNEIAPSSNFGDEPGDISEFVTNNSDEDCLDYTFANEPWIKDTRRAFITGEYLYMGKEEGTVSLDIKQAWSFHSRDEDIDRWKELSKQYHLDIKLYGIECGVQFCEEIIISNNGSVVSDREITYDDWDWDCPFPNMGG